MYRLLLYCVLYHLHVIFGPLADIAYYLPFIRPHPSALYLSFGKMSPINQHFNPNTRELTLYGHFFQEKTG
jgi:hypothetical protein